MHQKQNSMFTSSSWLSSNDNIKFFDADNNAVTANFGGAAIETEHTQLSLDKALIKGDRFSLNFNESSGRDLRDGRRILTSRQLNQGDNWRHEVGFGFTPLSSENLTLSVTGGMYDARRPANVRQQSFGLVRPKLGASIEGWILVLTSSSLVTGCAIRPVMPGPITSVLTSQVRMRLAPVVGRSQILAGNLATLSGIASRPIYWMASPPSCLLMGSTNPAAQASVNHRALACHSP